MAIFSTAQVAARLRISPGRVRRLANDYGVGTELSKRVWVYTEEDIAMLQAHSTGIPGRPRKLSESLELAASAAEDRAADAIRDGDSESAEVTLRLAGHLRRIAGNHRGSGNDPEQVS